MYLRSNLITVLKIKNVLLLLAGLFLVLTGMADVISLIAYYWGDWYTVINAVSFPEAVSGFFIGLAMLVYAFVSRNGIREAVFYSSYFETDLYGIIRYSDLSQATGHKPEKVRRDLHCFRKLYMKRFTFINDDGGEHIELNSKSVSCSCRNCGAVIEKKEYFTGICPYCKTADVFAAVITDDKVYSITNDNKSIRSDKKYYQQKGLALKFAWIDLAFAVSSIALLIFTMFVIDSIVKYNDYDYLTDLILSGKGYSTYELNQKEIVNFLVYDIFFVLIVLPLVVICIKKLILIAKSIKFAGIFSGSYTPFLSFSKLGGRNPASMLRRSIQSGYIKNCTIENHGGEMKISLAKKIVRDSCPYCGAPVMGAVGESYVCGFCKNKIIKVIEKK